MRGNPLARRGGHCINALAASCPVPALLTDVYSDSGSRGLLMLYGSGAPDRQAAIKKHRGPWVGFDLGYWDRDYMLRVSINAPHPKPELMRDYGPRLPDIRLRDDYDPKGHILLIGLGLKTRIWHVCWEQKTLAAIRQAYPGRRIIYRPKPGKEDPLQFDCGRDQGSSIEDLLRGAALVVCHHSNVAVDACIAGIPVVCEDGAARFLYGNDLNNPVQPSKEDRLRFLQRLAWWQWNRTEITSGLFWTWLAEAFRYA